MLTKLKKEDMFLTAFFAVYMFEYMVTSTLLNRGSTGVVPAQWQVRFYYIDMAFCVLGYIMFPAGRRFVRNSKIRAALMSAVALLYALGVCCCFFVRTGSVYMYLGPITLFCLGVMGGMVYYCMSVSLADSGCMGRVMGAGGAVAVLLQYVLQLTADISTAMPFVLLLGLAMMAWLLYKPQWNGMVLYGLPHKTHRAEQERATRISLVCAVVITALLILLCEYYDSRIEMLSVQSDFETINVFTWPRLCLAAAYLVMGFLGDLQNGKYVPLFTVCAMLISVLSPVLLASTGAYTLSMCLFYIDLGVIISYYNLTFWKLAPRTRCPELWASMGRILDGSIGMVIFSVGLANLSAPVIVGIDIVLLAGVIVAMVVGGDFTLSSASKIQEKVDNQTDPFDLMCERYQLTPRETEVLQKLLLTEDELQTIADSMYISRRVLSRHISSIYQKTGAKSRVGLYQIYHAVTQDT